MTSVEAWDRAHRIWPGIVSLRVEEISNEERPGAIAFWIRGGVQVHTMDRDGHALCHEHCIEREVDACR